MATYIGLGFSSEKNTAGAAREAAFLAKTQLKQPTVDCALVFSTIHYRPLETLQIIAQALNNPRMLGCSTAGIILSGSIETRGIGVLAIRSEDMQFGISSANDLASADMWTAGAELARNAVTDLGENRRQAFILFFDGFLGNNSLMVRGTQEVLGRAFPIAGAGSSDNLLFKETYQYFRDKPLTQSAAALLLGGQCRVGIGNGHGWKPLGKPRVADQTQNHIIKTIDGKRASGIYEEFFGVGLKELQSDPSSSLIFLYPLGIYMEQGEGYLLRNAVSILNDGSIVCQGDVPQGAEVHIMIGKKDFCKEAAFQAVRQAKDALAGFPPRFILVFEAASRQRLLGREAFQEIQTIQEAFGVTVPIFGMYSYAEIAPLRLQGLTGESYVQNENIVIVAVA